MSSAIKIIDLSYTENNNKKEKIITINLSTTELEEFNKIKDNNYWFLYDMRFTYELEGIKNYQKTIETTNACTIIAICKKITLSRKGDIENECTKK